MADAWNRKSSAYAAQARGDSYGAALEVAHALGITPAPQAAAQH